MGGVGRLPLGGEWVLDIGEADVGLVELVAPESYLSLPDQPHLDQLALRVDANSLARCPVAQLPEVGVVDGVADLNVVAGVKAVGPAGDLDAFCPSSPRSARTALARALSSSRCLFEVCAITSVRLSSSRSARAPLSARSSASRCCSAISTRPRCA